MHDDCDETRELQQSLKRVHLKQVKEEEEEADLRDSKGDCEREPFPPRGEETAILTDVDGKSRVLSSFHMHSHEEVYTEVQVCASFSLEMKS